MLLPILYIVVQEQGPSLSFIIVAAVRCHLKANENMLESKKLSCTICCAAKRCKAKQVFNIARQRQSDLKQQLAGLLVNMPVHNMYNMMQRDGHSIRLCFMSQPQRSDTSWLKR